MSVYRIPSFPNETFIVKHLQEMCLGKFSDLHGSVTLLQMKLLPLCGTCTVLYNTVWLFLFFLDCIINSGLSHRNIIHWFVNYYFKALSLGFWSRNRRCNLTVWLYINKDDIKALQKWSRNISTNSKMFCTYKSFIHQNM